MSTQVRTFSCTKDKTSRVTSKDGQGASDWLMIGRKVNDQIFRAFLDFSGFDDAANWNTGDKIVRIELVVTTSNEHNFSHGSKPGIKAGRLSDAWTEGNAPDGSWQDDEYTAIAAVENAPIFRFPLTDGVVPNNDTVYYDITSMMENVAPIKVKRRNDTPCGGKTFKGLKLVSESEKKDDYRVEIWGRGADTSSRRPYLRVTYDVGTVKPNAPTLSLPSGNTAPPGAFTGTFTSNQDSDVLSRVKVRVWNSAGTSVVQTIDWSASEADRLSGTFSIPIPASVKSGVDYKWDANVADQTGQWAYALTPSTVAWGTKKAFKITSTIPETTLHQPVEPLDSLKNYLFLADYSDADDNPLKSFRYQVAAFSDSPSWEWGTDLIYDSPELAPPEPDVVAFSYGGPALTANTGYSMRLRVEDSNGSVSEWSYADFWLSADYSEEGPPEDYLPFDEEAEPWYDGYDESAASQMTGYGRVRSAWRIVLKAIGTNRAPGAIKAIITDPTNMGASVYANSPGEMYFTLPAEHPQIGECEPYQRHYSIQKYVGDQWVERFAGILDDFDATEDEVVFHGLDYLGLVALAVDERKEGTKAVVLSPPGTGGSKYSEADIDVIIRDQLYQGKNQSNSWTGFISIPATGTTDWAKMTEKVSLATPYSPILGTILGLLESHKAGTGRRSRLLVKRTAENAYKWQLFDNYGKDRPNIRLEYGGLINGYRVVGFGDFGTVVLGLGRQREGVKILYANASPSLQVGGQSMQEVFGRVSKTAVWQDLYDESDLKRRVKERATKYGKVGKRVAVAVRVAGLDPLDGYDVMDSVPVVINRGPVQTDRYGSGMWTIWGVAWKLYPDGHEDINLTLLPKEDGVAINPDIVGSTPLLDEGDWIIGRDAPDPLVSGKYYLDQSTGKTYFWDADLNDWVEFNELALLGTPLKPGVSSAIVSGVVNLQVTL